MFAVLKQVNVCLAVWGEHISGFWVYIFYKCEGQEK